MLLTEGICVERAYLRRLFSTFFQEKRILEQMREQPNTRLIVKTIQIYLVISKYTNFKQSIFIIT